MKSNILNSLILLAVTFSAPAVVLAADDANSMKGIDAPVVASDPVSLSFFAGPYYYFTPKTPVGTQYAGSTSIPGPLNVTGSDLGFITGLASHVPLNQSFADSFDPKFSFWRVENDNAQPSSTAFVYTGPITNSLSTYGTGFNSGITGGNFKSTILNADIDLLLSKTLFQGDDYSLSLLYGISVGYYDETINENVFGPGASETGKYDTSSIRGGPSLGFNNSFKLPYSSTLDFSVLARLYFGANNLSGNQNSTPSYSGSNANFRNGDNSVTFSPQALANLKWNLPITSAWSFFVEGTGTLFINTPATQFAEPDYYHGSGPNDPYENGTRFGLMRQTTYGASGDVGFKFGF